MAELVEPTTKRVLEMKITMFDLEKNMNAMQKRFNDLEDQIMLNSGQTNATDKSQTRKPTMLDVVH